MATYQWQLIHSFTLPTDSKGKQLWRVDFDANYHNDLAELRQKYSEYQQELRGDVHTQMEFWVLLPTPETPPENNQIKPIDFKQLQDKERFKGELDYLHGQIEEILRDDNLENYPELNCALQDVHSLIEKLDIKIDYYNC
ncbi:hypothetical protein [Planktothrix agardhii]|uniref:hypothetical protein n=1 Tax=Planktothrix agardhii TaxID=1160 RepID=UPI002B208D50|nr:hypothetical protein [Planktothrix agardhii]MEA5563799.1 hypothetical protein [Planktothrix agardhii UHCC 0887]